jgi:atypical dual specificity phosphatase
MPHGFSWIEPGRVAGLARPGSPADLAWLRANGVQLLITLLPEPLPNRWFDDAGLENLHVPIHDFEAPTMAQFDEIVAAIRKATDAGTGVAVHCQVGRGRTGTALAAWLVARGMSPRDAIAEIRRLRPGSIETMRQEQAVEDYAERIRPGK